MKEFGKAIKQGVKEDTISFNATQWNYIVSYCVDTSVPDILDVKPVSISANMDTDLYFHECATNADMDSFMDDDRLKDLEPGMYQLTFGVVAKGDSYWTDCGYEYDAWEEYELIGMYKYTLEEEKRIHAILQITDGDLENPWVNE